MAPMSLPPGFRFHPTDEELVAYYLDRKINGLNIELEVIPEVDLYKCEPWDLPEKSFLPGKDMEWYFYSPRDRKYPNGSRTNRATKAGYWKATGKDRPIQSQKCPVGMKKTLVFYRGRAPHGIRTTWVMHEYRLIESLYGSVPSSVKDSYALCRVFKKTDLLPKSKGEQKNGDKQNETMWVSNDQSESEVELSHLRETENEDLNNDHYSKFHSETASSDLTQGTPAETGIVDDMQAPFNSDEANSSANIYSLGLDGSSNPFEMPYLTSVQYQYPYPPLELEDFPQINIDDTNLLKAAETMDEYMMCDKFRGNINGTLEEIVSLCTSQENSTSLTMLD